MLEETEKIGRGTLVDQVADRLRSLLFAGAIPPGERIRIRDLQSRFGVSHIPIREALRMLEAEGLVESVPQKGAVAAPVSVKLLDEVYDARRLIEPQVLRRAAVRASDEQMARAREMLVKMEGAEADGFGSFFEAHRSYHWVLLEPGATETLERILRQLWGTAERFVRISKVAYPADVEVARRQHRRLLELYFARDPAVGDLMEEHLHVTQHAIRAHYEDDDEASP